jgi:DNA-binding Lrp family transcriptional regulator
MRVRLQVEDALASFDEVLEARRVLGVPDYYLRVAVADANEYEAFQMHKLAALPAVARVISHQTMKVIKSDG